MLRANSGNNQERYLTENHSQTLISKSHRNLMTINHVEFHTTIVIVSERQVNNIPRFPLPKLHILRVVFGTNFA